MTTMKSFMLDETQLEELIEFAGPLSLQDPMEKWHTVLFIMCYVN